MPYFASRPTSPPRSFEIFGVASMSLLTFEIAYGLTSRCFDPRRRLQPHNGRRQRDLKDAQAAERAWNAGQIRPFVVPAGDAADVEAPDLVAAGPVAERLERDGGLERPPAFESSDLEIPDRIPVSAVLTLVGDLPVHPAAECIDDELHGVAPIVEGVEHEGDMVVLIHVHVVTAHLVDDHPLRTALPAAERDVHTIGIEETATPPSSRSPARLVGFLLNEIRNRRDRVVELLVEPTVQPKRRREAYRPNGGSSRLIPGDDLRRQRRWRTVEGEGRLAVLADSPGGTCAVSWAATPAPPRRRHQTARQAAAQLLRRASRGRPIISLPRARVPASSQTTWRERYAPADTCAT